MTVTRTQLRVGTRSSVLARTQTQAVVDALQSADAGLLIHTVLVATEGDKSDAPLVQIGGTGVFTSALRDALLAERIDVAVHSYKDLPTQAAEGICVGAVPAREDPRDALCARDGLSLLDLPAGSRVGTGSPRRAAQLRALDLGFDVVPIRGNVDTRLARVGVDLDAVVLAVAGLARIGRRDAATEVLDPLQMLPAAGQGALAVECRAGDERTKDLLASLDHAHSRSAVAAERSLLAGLEAGCSAPVGALAEISEDDAGGYEVFLRGSVTAVDGNDAVRLSASGPIDTAEEVGRRLAAELIDLGADTLMGSPT